MELSRCVFNRHAELEVYLSHHGISWCVIEPVVHVQLENEWNAVFGAVFSNGHRYRQGAKAAAELASISVHQFRIVPFLGAWGGPHSIGKRQRTAAYDCQGNLVSLAEFCDIDFFISPPDLEWTMIHTHEDHAIGGPYFVDRTWLVERPSAKRRTARHRKRRLD
jgi:hypothetical protein